jgi:hypothetical protein
MQHYFFLCLVCDVLQAMVVRRRVAQQAMVVHRLLRVVLQAKVVRRVATDRLFQDDGG